MNLLIRIPYVDWRQVAEESNNHHRTESIRGLRDISVGMRWVARNESFGPGQRLFFGFNLILPTAASYQVNPFSENADSVRHSHFALGSGQYIGDVNMEWWYRSEFPWVFGVSGVYRVPLGPSNLNYQVGRQSTVIFHGIKQKPLFKNTYIYLKTIYRIEEFDYWDNVKAPNSGGVFFDGIAGLNVELSEKISGVITGQFPLWRSFNGIQMDPTSIGLSLRWIVN